MFRRLILVASLCAAAGCVFEQPDTPPMPPGTTMPPPVVYLGPDESPAAPGPQASAPTPDGPSIALSSPPKEWKPGRFEVEPRTPCIGDTVTFRGTDLSEGVLSLKLGSPQSMSGGYTGKAPRCPPADAVDLGEHTIGPDGKVEVSFVLRAQLGPQLRLDPKAYYYFYFTYGPVDGPNNYCFGSYLAMALCEYAK